MPQFEPSDPRAAFAALLAAEEAERQRIAHELHSEIGQDLTAALLGLQFFAEEGVPADEVPELIGSIRRALERVRALSLRLRPPLLDEIDLGPALASSLAQIAAAREFAFELDVAEDLRVTQPLASILIFRSLQVAALSMPAGARLRFALQRSGECALRIRWECSSAEAGESLKPLLLSRLAALSPVPVVAGDGGSAQLEVELR